MGTGTMPGTALHVPGIFNCYRITFTGLLRLTELRKEYGRHRKLNPLRDSVASAMKAPSIRDEISVSWQHL